MFKLIFGSIGKKLSSTSSITVLLTLMVLLSSQVVSAQMDQQYKKITRLGTSQAICPGGVQTTAELQEYFANNPSAIRSILANSGWAGDADDLLAAVANGDVSERSYPVGARFAWMGLREKGQATSGAYREWAGAKSFEAFQVDVSSGCNVYHIAIPKACCNVALVSVAADTSSACQPVAAPAAPIVAAPVAKKAASLIPYFGVFAGSETRPRFETAWAMDMKDSSGIAGIRAGLMKSISDKNSVFGQLSYYDRNGINGGNVYPENNFAVDLGVERQLSERAFIGGGIGAWNVDDSEYRDLSLFGHVGGGFGKSNLQWFVEGRVFDSDSDNHDSISDNKMFSAGIRYLIK